MVDQNDTSEGSPLLQNSAEVTSVEDGNPPITQTAMSNRLACQIAGTMFSFCTIGLFNSSMGAVLPLLSSHYHLTDLHVSLIFLAGPVGYVIAAQCSDTIHARYGQRGIAVIGPIFQFISTATVALHPSFGMVLVGFAFQGVGAGLLDGSWCAWAGSMKKANTVSGMLHGSYSVGGAAGPFIVTAISTRGRPWYLWYSILAGASALSLVVLLSAFRHEDGVAYRKGKQSEVTDAKPDIKAMFKYPAVWLCAAYFITYVGTETAISGWIVSFMLRSRDATPYIAGITSSGYWIGMVIGRVSLGFATDRMGVRRATVLYFLLAVGIEVLFSLFSSPAVSIVLMALLGFVMGPMFLSAVVVLTRLLPGGAMLMPRACAKLGLGTNVQIVAEQCAEVVSREGIAAGRSPLSIAGACLYLVSHIMGQPKTPKEIGAAVEVSDGTIRTAYKLMFTAQDKIIQQDWIDKKGANRTKLPTA